MSSASARPSASATTEASWGGGWHRLAVSAVVLGVATRITLIATSFGSNDMAIWTGFVQEIRADGIWDLYVTDWWFNHPPLMGWGATALHDFADAVGLRFSAVFKSVMLGADLLTLALLWNIHRHRGVSPVLAAIVVYACNPVAIAVSPHHGNTDPLCAALLLLAARQQDRHRWFTAGLALAAAGNVKIVAAMALPGLAALIRNRQDLARFVAGGLVGGIPFALAISQAGTAFLSNVFGYESFRGAWGLVVVAAAAENTVGFGRDAFDVYEVAGRFLIIVAILGLAWLGRRREWSPYLAAVAPFFAFFVLTPGWGIQYHVWLVPLLAALSTRDSLRYSVLVGGFVAALYIFFLTGDFPLVSDHRKPMLIGLIALGLPGWVWMTRWLTRTVRSAGLQQVEAPAPRPTQSQPASGGLRILRPRRS